MSFGITRPSNSGGAFTRGFFRVCVGLACLLAGLALPRAFAANDQPVQLERLMADIARSGPGTVRFTETKNVALLKQPIESSGTLTYAAPSRLEKHTRVPREERLVVDGDTVVIEHPAKNERLTLRLANYPAIRAFVESIRGTLAGDLAALRRYYRIEVEGTMGEWRLHLLPSEQDMAELVQKIEISGSGPRIAQIEIREASGDRSVMKIAHPGA
jgi:outer membrane lipoprotein-sorting protein